MALVLIWCTIEANAIKLECDYKIEDIPNGEKNVLHCNAKNLRVNKPKEKVRLARNFFFEYKDVKEFRVNRQTMNYIFSGLDKFWPKLMYLSFIDCDVLRIFQADFKPFPKLLAIWLRGNKQLDVLERDLFKYNRKLAYLNLYNNNLKHIDSRIFDGLTSLTFVELVKNFCIGVYFVNGSMSELKKNIEDDCQDGNVLAAQFEFMRVYKIKND